MKPPGGTRLRQSHVCAFSALLACVHLAGCGGGDRQQPHSAAQDVPSIKAEDTVQVASTAGPLPAPPAAVAPGRSPVVPAPVDAPPRFESRSQTGGSHVPAQAQVPAACTLPSSIESPAVRGPDYRNAVRTDYLMLVLSWSPAFCAEQDTQTQRRQHAFQCTLNQFGFVVHGLWPQSEAARSSRDHPRHCRGSEPLPVALVRRHLCTVPGAELMQNEWQAHGTCHWSRADDYFAAIDVLWAQFRRPGVGELPREATAGEIKQAFVDVNGGRLEREHLQVTVASGNRLRDVRICLTADAKPSPRACPRGGTPDRQRVSVLAP
jgi:ribonuclease T2